MGMNLKGYCFNSNGNYGEPIDIETKEDISAFLTENVEKHYELRIVDTGDDCVFHVIDQVLIFPVPEQGSKKNKWNSELKKFQTV